MLPQRPPWVVKDIANILGLGVFRRSAQAKTVIVADTTLQTMNR